ncbi:MAG: precorrin-3B C(17)-methyltransferase [Clostridiales bacterium]|jgi:precorrin-3B C17-methyltransferase|nr:precorrin-3B C(17)-methyltransferase [Clostridiales bacterium]
MGKLYIVGFGPGNAQNMTFLCKDTLEKADVIVGYTGYINLLRDVFPCKTFYESAMTQEIQRCKAAIDLACGGKTVCIVSGGDSGIYAMASLVFELTYNLPEIEIEVIPGITAALSGAALTGAPLGNDFAVISLSDLLTPWDIIEKRLRAAAAGDFAICVYNPGSQKRTSHLRNACDILLETIADIRPCAYARNIGRHGQSITFLTLGELRDTQCGMTDTVFIGSSSSIIINGRLVTPRGYRHE